MSMTLGQRQIVAAYQASPMWTLSLPGDWASYAASTAWAPVAAALSTALGIAPDARARRGCYAQVVALLTQTAQQCERALNLNPTDRGALRMFAVELIRLYDPFTQN